MVPDCRTVCRLMELLELVLELVLKLVLDCRQLAAAGTDIQVPYSTLRCPSIRKVCRTASTLWRKVCATKRARRDS